MKTLLGLAIAALIVTAIPASAKAPANAVAPRALQAEFDTFITRFRAALKANDADAVAVMTQFPLQGTYADAAQFRTKGYPTIFKPKARACIQRTKAIYERDGLGKDGYFLFCGDDIFVFTKTPPGFLFTEVGVND